MKSNVNTGCAVRTFAATIHRFDQLQLIYLIWHIRCECFPHKCYTPMMLLFQRNEEEEGMPYCIRARLFEESHLLDCRSYFCSFVALALNDENMTLMNAVRHHILTASQVNQVNQNENILMKNFTLFVRQFVRRWPGRLWFVCKPVARIR